MPLNLFASTFIAIPSMFKRLRGSFAYSHALVTKTKRRAIDSLRPLTILGTLHFGMLIRRRKEPDCYYHISKRVFTILNLPFSIGEILFDDFGPLYCIQ